MGGENKEMKDFNINVLQSVSCSIGILVDCGLEREDRDSSDSTTGAGDTNMKLNVAVLFFGGKDDPEAVAYASRLALHPGVNVTLIRFLVSLKPSYRYNNGPSNVFSESDSLFVDVDGRDPNEDFIENIYNRFVATGMMTYLEVAVQEPKELVDALSSLNGAYTLYVVGQQVQGPMKLIATNSHWEDCPVLGSIGGLLASEFMSKGSVLVIHQYNNGTNSSVKFMSSERIWHEEHLT